MVKPADVPVRLLRHTQRWIELASLQLRNWTGRASVTGEANTVVSLTTYGQRTHFVHLAIESIARGTLRPKRIILWLDEPDSIRNPPVALQRLVKRGLEIRECANYGPHKKYYPYISSLDAGAHIDPLTIVDDDFLYPKEWLQSLLESHERYPNAVSCTRAHEIQVHEQIMSYSTWPSCRTDRPSFRTFATGVGGVLYPASVQLMLKRLDKEFAHRAPKADDVWLHYAAVLAKVKVRQVGAEPLNLEFRILPFAQGDSLQATNVGQGANDRQIASTYDRIAIETLRANP